MRSLQKAMRNRNTVFKPRKSLKTFTEKGLQEVTQREFQRRSKILSHAEAIQLRCVARTFRTLIKRHIPKGHYQSKLVTVLQDYLDMVDKIYKQATNSLKEDVEQQAELQNTLRTIREESLEGLQHIRNLMDSDTPLSHISQFEEELEQLESEFEQEINQE